MTPDRITTYIGLTLATLHQLGIVGTLPATKTEWMQTGMSVLLALLGYFSNKIPVGQAAQ